MKWTYRIIGGLVAFTVFALLLNATPLVWRNVGIVMLNPVMLPGSHTVEGAGVVDGTNTRVLGFGILPEGNAALMAIQQHRITGEVRVSILPLETKPRRSQDG